ncbi:MAG: YhfC family intramembrane metalloprotease [Chloroflexi bacterium]|nr:YhfC family intramembrane metalloprotease [Chloroflexota bacterium]
MVYAFYAVNFMLMIALPLILARFIAQRRQIRWGLFGIGALTFVLSQVGHIPFNWLVLQRFEWVPTDNLILLAIFAGLSAGVFEEAARYLTYRFWAKDARTWGTGLMLGAGHGGIEAILLGLLSAWGIIQLAAFQSGNWLEFIPPDLMPTVEAAIVEAFSAPWYRILLGALERLLALCLHLGLSLLVMQGFVRGQRRWLWIAILWHGMIDATAVYAISTWGAYVTEAIVAGMALFSLGIIFWLKTPEPVELEPEPLPEVGPAKPIAINLTADSLEKSRFE